MSSTIFVSGATGFIAQHIVKVLVEKNYKVVGSVRSIEKGEVLKKLLNSENFNYEVVENIATKGAFDEALKKHPEVSIFLHTASPFHFNVEDVEKELLIPAVNGTKNALETIKAHAPQIKRVVITSSYTAVMNLDRDMDPTYRQNEDTWNPMTWDDAKQNAYVGYLGSKKLAEAAAWEFLAVEKPNFQLSVVNPVYVFGPQAFDAEVKDTLGTSAEFFNSILKAKGDEKAIPDLTGRFIDIRDVAMAHIVAFENDAALNQRLVLNGGGFSTQIILDLINRNIPQLSGKIPVGNPGSGDEKLKQLAALDTDKTKKILGFKYLDLKTTVIDSFDQLLRVKSSK